MLRKQKNIQGHQRRRLTRLYSWSPTHGIILLGFRV